MTEVLSVPAKVVDFREEARGCIQLAKTEKHEAVRTVLLGMALGICCGVLAAANSGSGAKPFVDKSKLAVREEPNQILLTLSGPVAEPMRDDVIAALDRFKADPRRIVISLNSPGGSVAYGRTVAAVIRKDHGARSLSLTDRLGRAADRLARARPQAVPGQVPSRGA